MSEEEIVSIEKIEDRELMDIELDGDHLFYANGILTHNSGFAASEVSMTDISESFATTFISDFIIGLIATEELKDQGKILVKQLKNRYRDLSRDNKFFIGFDRSKMRFYDLDDPKKGLYGEETSDVVMDNGEFGSKLQERGDFSDFKFD